MAIQAGSNGYPSESQQRVHLGFHRTCHGNAPPVTGEEGSGGGSSEGGVRIAFAICYAPVARRTAEVHKRALLKGRKLQ